MYLIHNNKHKTAVTFSNIRVRDLCNYLDVQPKTGTFLPYRKSFKTDCIKALLKYRLLPAAGQHSI